MNGITDFARQIIEYDDWPEPLPFGENNPPEIFSDLLPGYLGQYCGAVAKATQTPAGLAVMMALSATAACLQKRFEVAPYGDDYKEPLSVWTNTGLDSGARKTAVTSAITQPLTLWEDEQAEKLKSEISRTNHERDLSQKRIEQVKAKAAKPDTSAADREAYLREILAIEDATPDQIGPPRIWTDDVTPERLQAMMAENQERMALISDEGGIFEIMAGLYSNGHANLNVFLQGHAGSPVRVDRQGRSVTLDRPALSFGLSVQPDIISNLAQGSKARFRGNGLLARFLYCAPESNVGRREVRKRVPIPEPTRNAYHAGIMQLLNIAPVYDEQGREYPRILTLSPNALEAWQRFSQYIEDRLGPDGDLHSIRDWAGKLPGAALRIAGLFHVVQHGITTAVIGSETIERALDLCDLLIPHALAAFDLMGEDQITSDAKAILTWIKARREPSFTQDEIYKGVRRFRHGERLEKALRVLIDRHIISEPTKKVTGGRPSMMYHVNPKILGTH